MPIIKKKQSRTLGGKSPFATLEPSNNASFTLGTLLLVMVVGGFFSAMLMFAWREPNIRSSVAALFGVSTDPANLGDRRGMFAFVMFCYASPLVSCAILCTGVLVFNRFFVVKESAEADPVSDDPFAD